MTEYDQAIIEFQDGTAICGIDVEWGTSLKYSDPRGREQQTKSHAVKRVIRIDHANEWKAYLKGSLSPVFIAPSANGAEGAPDPELPTQ